MRVVIYRVLFVLIIIVINVNRGYCTTIYFEPTFEQMLGFAEDDEKAKTFFTEIKEDRNNRFPTAEAFHYDLKDEFYGIEYVDILGAYLGCDPKQEGLLAKYYDKAKDVAVISFVVEQKLFTANKTIGVSNSYALDTVAQTKIYMIILASNYDKQSPKATAINELISELGEAEMFLNSAMPTLEDETLAKQKILAASEAFGLLYN